jgi:hypothetical protein
MLRDIQKARPPRARKMQPDNLVVLCLTSLYAVVMLVVWEFWSGMS